MRTVQRYTPEIVSSALSLRKQGFSFREIREKLAEHHIPRNTLSGWIAKAGIVLTDEQQSSLRKRVLPLLQKAQKNGGKWQKEMRKIRKENAQVDASLFLKENVRTRKTDMFFLSGLHLGEGAKDDWRVLFANANVKVIQAYLCLFRSLFPIDEKRLHIHLFVRYDQDKNELETYWSNMTGIPRSQFNKTHKDVRTKHQKTFDGYKGVCAICYSDAKIQRFLLELQRQYVEKILG